MAPPRRKKAKKASRKPRYKRYIIPNAPKRPMPYNIIINASRSKPRSSSRRKNFTDRLLKALVQIEKVAEHTIQAPRHGSQNNMQPRQE